MTQILSKKEEREILKKRQRINIERDARADESRARAITIGTAFGGTTDIMMRRFDGSVTWAHLQPVEVIELIHQLAANVGCHIQIQPRRDFASWRNWKYTDEELEHYRGHSVANGSGHPPHANDMAPHNDRAATLPRPEQQPGLQPAIMARSESNEQTVATQKTVGRKRTKRAATPA